LKTESLENPAYNGMEIAVIGMAGRFPGANNLDEYWENLKNGVESISFFSDEELIEMGIHPDLLENPNYVRAMPVCDGIEYFDAAFFDYAPGDAEVMDPQVRLFHEYSWSALEDAGYSPESYPGLIGVYFGGIDNLSWKAKVLLRGDHGRSEFLDNILSNKDFLSTRISYKFNLRGPSYTIYTGCSTALTSIHFASRNLLSGECDMAIAGGVVIFLPLRSGYLYQEGMIFSSDGHIRTFDEKATGAVFGSGIGVVILKPLDRALLDRDSIYAIIKGSAVNNDGIQKVSFTAPSVKGQAQVIKTAHQIAEIEPNTISYIETHGTGTDLGDSIEIKALKQAFAGVHQDYTCKIGSVKTNFGHLDSAAGAAGFIKTVLTLTHKLIPPSLHFNSPNPNSELDDSPFRVNTGLTKWENGSRPLRAGLSSFGFGGTNAHAVLEETPLQRKSAETRPSRKYQLLLISAKTETALERGTENLLNHLKANTGIKLADAAYTLQVGRKAFNHRRMVICSDVDKAIEALSSPAPGKARILTLTGDKPQVVFMFPGQGSQYVNMGLDLYETEPVFRHEMDRCFEILKSLMDHDIKETLYPGDLESKVSEVSEVSEVSSNNSARPPGTGDSPLERGTPGSRKGGGVFNINQTEITQPVIFAIEYALAKLLMKWGITPDSMIAHSIGEYVAAHLSGVFSLEDALKLVVLRGRLMQNMPTGAMLSVTLPQEDLIPLLMNKELSLAAVNSSSLCTVSGSHEAIDAFENQLEEKGIGKRRLHTSHAFHSNMMDPILQEFAAHVQQVKLNTPEIPYISNVTGTWITVEDATNPGYWAKHLRGTIRFSEGLKELLNQENSIFIEVGPGLVLSSFVNKHKDKQSGHVTKNLVRHPREPLADDFYLLNKIGELWLYGIDIDWSGFYSGEKRYRLHLPTYSFDRTRYWIDQLQLQIVPNDGSKATSLQKKEISDWFYIPSWIRTGLTVGKKNEISDPIHYLVFIDECNLGLALLERLSQKKQEVVMVKAGTAYTRENDNQYVINPKEEKDYETLFEELAKLEKTPVMIIHLWNVTPGIHCQLDRERIENAQEKGFYSLLHIARAIGNQGITGEIRLKAITSNMQEVSGNELLCPEKAVIMGAVKVIPLEFENIICDCIDIDFPESGIGKDDILIDQLLQEFEMGPPDTLIAYRGNYRWVQTFEPVRLEKPEGLPSRLREEGVYLVTGGLGGMGLVLAEHLARSVRARLILVGRSAFPLKEEWEQWLDTHETEDRVSLKIQKIKELEEMGARVIAASADVADMQQIKEVIDRAREQFGPLNGVIHSAGIVDYGGIIQVRSREITEEVLAPKITGTLILDTILKDFELDFFILCSSTASIVPSFGEVAYVGSNAFLDQFAYFKTASSGVYCTSINWWTWKETGMAVDAAERMAKKKVASAAHDILKDGISSSQGVDIFNRILDNPFQEVIIFLRDLKAMAEQYRASKQKPKTSQPSVESTSAIPKYQRPQLNTAYAAPGDEIEKTLTEIWQNQLGIQQIGIHDNFFDLGADSLNIVQVRTQIKNLLKKDVTVVILYTYPTVSALREYLEDEKATLGFSEEETERLQKKESKGRSKLRQRQQRVKN
jgi:acyl transferase domain-containing protein/acyl carrier protein